MKKDERHFSDTPEIILKKIERGNSTETTDKWDFGKFYTEKLFLEGNIKKTKSFHERVLAIDPNHSWANFGMGRLYAGMAGEKIKSIEFFRNAITIAEKRKEIGQCGSA